MTERHGADVDAFAKLIGFDFADRKRLALALTHASARSGKDDNYERLEFLGDRVLGLVIAENLFRLFPGASEGELSVRLNQLVSAEACARVADDLGWLLLDMKDLRAMLNHVYEQRAELGPRYGNISPASVGAIQRSLLRLEQQLVSNQLLSNLVLIGQSS